MKLILILAMALASKCTEYREFIQVEVHNVPGVSGIVASSCYHQKVGTQVYTLDATDITTAPLHYRIGNALEFDSVAVESTNGATIDGDILTWPAHKQGDILTINLIDGPCSCGIPQIKYRATLYTPLLASEAP